MFSHHFVTMLTAWAGAAQIALIIGSLAIPHALDWGRDVAKLRPLTRQVFWVYAGYIWCTNLAFGLLSAWAPESLLDGSTLATAVTAFIAVYWGARLVIQFTYFDRGDLPRGTFYRWAEGLLTALFAALTAVYSYAVAFNIGQSP